MLGRELDSRANKLVRESKERAEVAKRQADKEKILRARQEERRRQFEEQQRQQRLAEAAAIEAVSVQLLRWIRASRFSAQLGGAALPLLASTVIFSAGAAKT